MTGMKPNVDMIMQRKVSGHSPAHVKWSAAKKAAAQHGADLSQLPKEDLGPLLDDFRQYVRGAGELARLFTEWKAWDQKALKPLQDTRKKIDSAAIKYQQVCDRQANTRGITPAVKNAWLSLKTAASTAQAEPRNMVNEANKQLRQEKLLELPWTQITK